MRGISCHFYLNSPLALISIYCSERVEVVWNSRPLDPEFWCESGIVELNREREGGLSQAIDVEDLGGTIIEHCKKKREEGGVF